MPSTPRKIAFCITELDPGGAERALVEIVTRLPRDHWSPRVISLGPPAALVGVLEQAGIAVESLGARSAFDVAVVNRLRRSLQRDRPEILQTFMFHANVAGRLAGWLAGVPHIVSGLRVAEREKAWHNRLERLTGHWAKHHVAVSAGVATFARETLRFPAMQISVIPNGVEVSAYSSLPPQDWTSLNLPADARVILAAGRLHPQKGFHNLIPAVTPLLKSHSNWFLVIAGEGPQRAALEQRVGEVGLAGRILLPGFTDDLPQYLRGADLFVLSSLWEGMPNVLLQAMAAGRSVVATAVEGVTDLMGAAAADCIVKPNSVDDLRLAIERQMLSTDLRERTGIELQHIVAERFTWRRVAQEYSALYARILR